MIREKKKKEKYIGSLKRTIKQANLPQIDKEKDSNNQLEQERTYLQKQRRLQTYKVIVCTTL